MEKMFLRGLLVVLSQLYVVQCTAQLYYADVALAEDKKIFLVGLAEKMMGRTVDSHLLQALSKELPPSPESAVKVFSALDLWNNSTVRVPHEGEYLQWFGTCFDFHKPLTKRYESMRIDCYQPQSASYLRYFAYYLYFLYFDATGKNINGGSDCLLLNDGQSMSIKDKSIAYFFETLQKIQTFFEQSVQTWKEAHRAREQECKHFLEQCAIVTSCFRDFFEGADPQAKIQLVAQERAAYIIKRTPERYCMFAKSLLSLVEKISQLNHFNIMFTTQDTQVIITPFARQLAFALSRKYGYKINRKGRLCEDPICLNSELVESNEFCTNRSELFISKLLVMIKAFMYGEKVQELP